MRSFIIGDLRKEAALLPQFSPFPHQAEAERKFRNTGTIVLAHPVGSGKTFTAVHLGEEARRSGRMQRALVVVPTALRDNFSIEGVKKFSDATVQVFGGKEEARTSGDRVTLETADPNINYSVVGYELFRADPLSFVRVLQPDMLIVDEYHRAKDEDSLTFKALAQVRPHVDQFIGMTASLVSNDPSDVAPLVGLATMGRHPFSDRAWFKNRYEYISGMEKGFFGGEKKRKSLKNVDELQEMLSDVVHYVSPQQVAKDKPRRTVVEVSVEMSPLQRRYYHYALNKLSPELAERVKKGLPPRDAKEARSMFKMLMDARRASNSVHPFSRFFSPAEGARLSPKVVKMLDDAEAHIRSTPDARIMMYSELIDGGMDVLAAGLEDRGIPFRVFAGKGREVAGRKITDESRRKAKEDFIAGRSKVLLVSPSGAEGLDLHNMTMLQSLDAHFNPERIHQVEGRGWRSKGQAHRPPEEREVIIRRYRSVIPPNLGFVDRLLGHDKHERTVDEWIYQTAAAKDRLNSIMRMAMSGQRELIDDPKWVFTPYRDLRLPPANRLLAQRLKKMRRDRDTLSGKSIDREDELLGKDIGVATMDRQAKPPSGEQRIYNTSGRYEYEYKVPRPDGSYRYVYPE